MKLHTQNASQSFLTRKEASLLLGVSGKTITRWVNRGILQAWRTAGGQSRIARNSVETMLIKRKGELESSRGNTSPKILVVEDDLVLLDLYQTHISRWEPRIQLVSATDGFSALIQVGKTAPDLIITDLVMHGMDGFQMIRKLKETPEFRNVQIIVVTILDKDEILRQEGFSSEITVLHKPISYEQLKRVAFEKLELQMTIAN